MRAATALLAGLALALTPATGVAQLTDPDAPDADAGVAPADAGDGAADQLTVPPPPTGTAPPPGPLPPATAVGQVPIALVVGPLVTAAERDLAESRGALALARASLAVDSLAPGEPLRIRAEGLVLLARQRVGPGDAAPNAAEAIAPVVAQAELDVRAGQAALAVARLDFALSRLAPGTPLYARAVSLRQLASGPTTQPMPNAAPAQYGLQPAYQPPPPPPADPTRRGGGEAAELYVTAGLLGALTGGWLPYVSSDGTAAFPVYTLTVIGGAGLFVVGALALDLGLEPTSGVEPTISASIRFGVVNGMFAFALYEGLSGPSTRDPSVSFSLVWAGGAAGAALGLALGFGLEPEVRDERFVESAGIWGLGLAGSFAMLTNFDDGPLIAGVGIAGLNAGWLIGALSLAGGAEISVDRTLVMDLGFLGGFGAGVLIPLLGYYVAQSVPEPLALGIGSLIGSLAGWSIALAVTDGWGTEAGSRAAAEEPRVRLGISPVENGAVLGVDGQF